MRIVAFARLSVKKNRSYLSAIHFYSALEIEKKPSGNFLIISRKYGAKADVVLVRYILEICEFERTFAVASTRWPLLLVVVIVIVMVGGLRSLRNLRSHPHGHRGG